MSKRVLSVAEAVEAASLLFELNTDQDGLIALAEKAGMPEPRREEEDCSAPADALWREWAAFVHAAVLYALMAQAPNVVVVEYLRTTRAKLEARGYDEDRARAFVDASFSLYVRTLLLNEPQNCPEVFFRNYLGADLRDVPKGCVAVFSGTMAMIMAAVADKLEQYEFSLR